MTSKEQKCENHFLLTYTRNENGRFVVKLPFKQTGVPLGSSRQIAERRLMAMERRLAKNSDISKQYKEFMNEYLELEHMSLIPEPVEEINSCYLPHHAVIKESSISTKLRVVFDGSCKTDSGQSLNDNLLVGPVVQPDLFSILLRFRTYQVALVADISKMYRQIIVHKDDRKYQRIVWRFNSSEQIRSYELHTVTYGTSSAPFLATRCLHQIAIDTAATHKLASPVIFQNFYVDDLLSGANSIEETIELRNELIHALSQYGFELCKWASNQPKVLLDNTISHSQNVIVNLDNSADMKTLGLIWNSQSDTFKYTTATIDKSVPKSVTKRNILSTIAKIFDPLGLVGPIITKAKILLQQIWILKLNWDASVPTHIHTSWTQYLEELSYLNLTTVPRLVTTTNIRIIELHGFSDASEAAYGACIYLRTTDNDNISNSKLLCSKSRVAPLKKTSIPRLELCSGVLLAQLMDKAAKELNLPITNKFYWTDSTIVLAWLDSPSSHWQTFVANRVSEIQGLSEVKSWRHVRSQDNPADCLSRGLLPQQLQNFELWWTGPKWLLQTSDCWPNTECSFNMKEIPTEQLEIRKTIANIATNTNPLLCKFSSYTKLKRIVALCMRFVNNTKSKINKRTGPLTVCELNNANQSILKMLHMECFPREIAALNKNKLLSNKSSLISLNPFLDANGLLRVGGRLRNANISLGKKYPILLPKNHFVSNLIIKHIHSKQLHAGAQATLAALREEYWPMGSRSAVRKVLHKCIKCFRANPQGATQIMGDLPPNRVNPCRPFLQSGIDYAGPIQLKDGHGRSKKILKSYIALFICLATKAIHIELVCDLTTESFLAALKRFIARRGKVMHIYSDNATNFVGANRELTNLFNNTIFKSNIVQKLSEDSIQWHFIPPRAPHFGGIWEAGIKSVKYHIKRTIGETLLNYDEMTTLLCQIESCLNSRPITPISNDPNDFSALTPGHFLIGNPLTSNVEPDIKDLHINRLSRWQHVQYMFQHFWKRWTSEYLSTLQQRPKWQRTTHTIKLNDLVIIKEDNIPPFRWPMGRIIQLHPGKDNVVRVVTIKTKSSEVKRALSKVFVLPIDNS